MRRVLLALVLVGAVAVVLAASAVADGPAENEPPASTSSESDAVPDEPCPIDENGDCLPDRDRDGRSDTVDNCPDHWNPGQEDNDGDGVGNPCDPTPNGHDDGDDEDDGDPPPPPGGCSSTAPVILYEHVDFGGACWGFSPGSHSWVGDGANDKASSIRVAAGYVVSLFEHGEFGGSWHNTETSASPWGWSNVGNDNVSSLVVQASEPDPSFYEGEEVTTPDGIGFPYATTGCARVGDAVNYKRFDRTFWTYALRVSFCWNGTTITSLWARDVVVDIKPLPFPANLIASWTYTPVEFVPGEPDHTSTNLRTAGKFEYCGFRYGCLNPRHPWVAIELRASGSATCTSSVARNPRVCPRGRA
jgi:hypothetical protein